MPICVVCGKENDSYLCDECRRKAEIAQICRDIIKYRPNNEEKPNPVLKKIWESFDDPYGGFKNIVFELSYELDSPESEYIRIISMTGNSSNVKKDSRPWFYDIYSDIKDAEGLSDYERNRLYGIALGAYYMDYEYFKAEELASYLLDQKELPWQVHYNMSEFYMNTRRYDMAEKVINDALQNFADDKFVVDMMTLRAGKNEKQRKKAAEGKKEYMPNPKENAAEVKQKYIEFMNSIGINVEAKSSKSGSSKTHSGSSRNGGIVPISRDEYPDSAETRNADMDTFVAFDLETTGRGSYDSIIEIGAVKVRNNKIVDKAGFKFQELVKPLDGKHVKSDVSELTGITDDEVQSARPVWEVFPDFMDFVGDDVLVGYNCIKFDSRYMVRAGRYSHRIVENKYFDVMKYAVMFFEKLDIKKDKKAVKLELLAEKLNVKNPRAHRALADAMTTAAVFLKLKEMDDRSSESNVDDLLGDIESW